MDKRIERIIIDRGQPEKEPDVEFGDWVFAVTGENKVDGRMSISSVGDITTGTVIGIGQAVRKAIEHFSQDGKYSFVELVQLFMKGFSDDQVSIQLDGRMAP